MAQAGLVGSGVGMASPFVVVVEELQLDDLRGVGQRDMGRRQRSECTRFVARSKIEGEAFATQDLAER